MKAVLDEDPRPPRFLLTGSARLLALSSLPDALPGTETIELWPLRMGSPSVSMLRTVTPVRRSIITAEIGILVRTTSPHPRGPHP